MTNLLALGMVLATATQLRVAGLIGPGEVFLVAWLFFALIQHLLGARRERHSSEAEFTMFWLVVMVSTLVGLLATYPSGKWDSARGLRDLAALAFSAGVSILAVSSLSDANLRRAVSSFLTLATAGLLAMLVMAVTTPWLINPWYSGIRFTGWSDNPNQLALLLLCLPFLAIWAYRRTDSKHQRRALSAALVVSIFAGILCQSEALYVAWLIAFGLMSARQLARYFSIPTGLWKTVTIKVAVPFLGAFLLVVLSVTIFLELTRIVGFVYEVGGQGQIRLRVWWNGILAFLSAPLFGLGPGSFSGIDAPFQHREAHNTIIDLATQSGIIGTAAYLALLLSISWRLIASRESALLSAFIALFVFSSFHYVLRHPTYWFALVLLARLTAHSRAFDFARSDKKMSPGHASNATP